MGDRGNHVFDDRLSLCLGQVVFYRDLVGDFIRGGKFKVKATPEREARNPANGATIKVAAAKKLAFTPDKALKDA
ncbi:HU family DNA-binding protein, partial [Rhizobium ruizarguesonis]